MSTRFTIRRWSLLFSLLLIAGLIAACTPAPETGASGAAGTAADSAADAESATTSEDDKSGGTLIWVDAQATPRPSSSTSTAP